MRQGQKTIGILCALVLFFIAGRGESSAGKRVSIHPSFQALLVMYPRNVQIVNPQVPRISPQTALNYYGSGRAIFIAAGGGAIQAGLPGAISLTSRLQRDPSRLLKLRDKLIIIFCH